MLPNELDVHETVDNVAFDDQRVLIAATQPAVAKPERTLLRDLWWHVLGRQAERAIRQASSIGTESLTKLQFCVTMSRSRSHNLSPAIVADMMTILKALT